MQITLRPEVKEKVMEESRKTGRMPTFIVNHVLGEVVFREAKPEVMNASVEIPLESKSTPRGNLVVVAGPTHCDGRRGSLKHKVPHRKGRKR